MALPQDTSIGPPSWRVVAALVLVGALLVALVVVSGREVDQETAPATPREFVVEPAAEPASGSTESDVSSPTASDVLPSQPERVEGDLDAALRAWGLFAATGDLDAVAGVFGVDGPQYAQLQSEVDDRQANAPGLPPFEFTMAEPEIVTSSPSAMVLRGDVEVQREGVAPESYRWDVEMRWDADLERWVLWTVAAAGA